MEDMRQEMKTLNIESWRTCELVPEDWGKQGIVMKSTNVMFMRPIRKTRSRWETA